MFASIFGGQSSSTAAPSSFTAEESAVYASIQKLVADFGAIETTIIGLFKPLKGNEQASETTSAAAKEQLEALASKMQAANVELTSGMEQVAAALGGAGAFPEKCSQALRSVVMKINTVFTAASQHLDSKIVDPVEEGLAKDFQEIYDCVLLRKTPSRFTEVSEKEKEG